MFLRSTIITSFINELKKGVSISGRTSRGQYLQCWFVAINLIVLWVSITAPSQPQNVKMFENVEWPSFLAVTLLYIFMIILDIRRVHDLGHKMYFVLLKIIPIVGFFIVFYMCFKSGDLTYNKYGPPPLTSKLTLIDKIWLWSVVILSLLFLVIAGFSFYNYNPSNP